MRFLLFLILCPILLLASDNAMASGQNYIVRRDYLNATGTEYVEVVEYFDGLGRSVETVQRGITPSGQSLVTVREYDSQSRLAREWQPVVSPNTDFTDPSEVLALATALGSNYAVNEQDFRWVVVHEFERQGWRVEAVYLGNPMRHDEKYLLINQGFAGKQRLVPFFNRSNNEDLILAIQSADVSRGRNGFRKDKSGEKLAESEEDLLEHGTYAFDTLYIGAEKFPYREAFSLPTTGIL